MRDFIRMPVFVSDPDDIVKRLRDPSRASAPWADTMDEAAGEIERLRAVVLRMVMERHRCSDLCRTASAGRMCGCMQEAAEEMKDGR